MLRVVGPPQRMCDGVRRRTFLRIGAAGALGLGLPMPLRAAPAAAPAAGFGAAKRCILLFLTGGPPQHDTWDPKPNAPAQIRGEFKPIPTAIPGLQFSELFPLLARRANHLCVVRSVTHVDTVHTSAGYTMLTGVPHPFANTPDVKNIKPTPHDHPHVGALLAVARRPAAGVPPFVALPEAIKDDVVNPYPGLDGGFLGTQFSPFLVNAADDKAGFRLPDVLLPADVTGDRLADRRSILGRLDHARQGLDGPATRDAAVWRAKAYDVVGSAPFSRAFALDREPPAVRDAYGRHLFGQGCLLARRLVEAGVGLAAVYWHYEGPQDSPVWDTHANNFKHMRERLAPPTDRAVAALLDDLDGRGLLADTLVIVMGEFGRSPRVNKEAGRDHWPGVQTILLAGAGIKAGVAFGSSDRDGGRPSDNPVGPADLTATLLHLLGVPPATEVRDRTGRPVVACTGEVVRGVIA
jgi:hypothetical protein